MHWTLRQSLAARIEREAPLVTGVTFSEGESKTLALEKVCRHCSWSTYHALSSGVDNSIPAKQQARGHVTSCSGMRASSLPCQDLGVHVGRNVSVFPKFL